MIDTEFLAALRDWARLSAHELGIEADRSYESRAGGLACMLHDRFAALDDLLTVRLDAERARLALAFEEAENKRKAIVQEHGDWTMITHYHDEQVGKALAAMANFDTATKGGRE